MLSRLYRLIRYTKVIRSGAFTRAAPEVINMTKLFHQYQHMVQSIQRNWGQHST